jgi:hypothetical protein
MPARSRLGYRGWTLTFLGVVWFAVGARIFTRGDLHPGHTMPIEYLNEWVRVAIWWGSAIIAFVTAWWPPGKTKWGFVALMIPAGFRAGSYLGAVMFGYWSVLVDALVWTGIVGFVMLCADWPEPVEAPDGES